MPAKSDMTMAREARVRRIGEIEDRLARPPTEPGPAGDRELSALNRELDRLRAVQAHIATRGRG
jgi:hypothetical protein